MSGEATVQFSCCLLSKWRLFLKGKKFLLYDKVFSLKVDIILQGHFVQGSKQGTTKFVSLCKTSGKSITFLNFNIKQNFFFCHLKKWLIRDFESFNLHVFTLRTTKTLGGFGRSECNRVNKEVYYIPRNGTHGGFMERNFSIYFLKWSEFSSLASFNNFTKPPFLLTS